MDDLTDLDGVATGRADNLAEAGYETIADLAEADAETVAENVNYLPEDTALDLIVQSQNIVAEDEADIEESQPVTEEVADAIDGSGSGEEVNVSESGEADPEATPETIDEEESEDEEEELEDVVESYEFEVEFNAALEYDTFFDAVMAQRSKMLRTNRSGVEAFDHALDQMREGGTDEPVSLSMTENQLNDLHNSVRQKSVEYKGDNLIDHMDALNSVLNQINEARDDHLF